MHNTSNRRPDAVGTHKYIAICYRPVLQSHLRERVRTKRIAPHRFSVLDQPYLETLAFPKFFIISDTTLDTNSSFGDTMVEKYLLDHRTVDDYCGMKTSLKSRLQRVESNKPVTLIVLFPQTKKDTLFVTNLET
jgi:hypothetical protein